MSNPMTKYSDSRWQGYCESCEEWINEELQMEYNGHAVLIEASGDPEYEPEYRLCGPIYRYRLVREDKDGNIIVI